MKIIKVIFVIVSICLISLWSRAQNHNPPAGPPGPPGPAGQSIVGPAGANGSDADGPDRLNAYLGAGVRLYDAKYWSANTYVNQDVWHGGTVIGGLIMFKLGKSYEEREIDALRADLKASRAYLNDMANRQNDSEEPIHAKIRGSK